MIIQDDKIIIYIDRQEEAYTPAATKATTDDVN
jgi:hypothetical protein